MDQLQVAKYKVVCSLVFKTVDSKDAVVKATWTYIRRVLKAR